MKPKRSLIKPLIILASLPLIVLGLKTAIDLRKGASGTPANIVIDAITPHGSTPTILWQNFSQGGEEPLDMIGPIVSLVRPLAPKLIRIDHLFDYYNVYVGPNSYDFNRLDKAIDSILATGAKPMLSISYTPAQLAKENKVANEPNDWEQWNNLVRATAKHYSVERQIDGIYYEIWNEPDLFGGWHYGKTPSYTTLYANSARAIAEGAGSSRYKIGGPAITSFYANWFRSLLKTCTANNLPLHFISWHRYSKNIDDYLRDYEQINNILADYPNFLGIERVITEIGPNSEPDRWYDNHLSAIHLLSLSSNLAGKINRIFSFELVDGPAKRTDGSNGWGMITHPLNGSRPKPRYQAIRFLNQMNGQRLGVEGNGSWVSALATKDSGTIEILLTNYDPRGTHSETFPFRIIGLANGTYTFRRTDFLGSTNSRDVEILNNRFTENFYLEPNTAVLIEIIPQ